jgi:hypothetical protein
VVYLETKIIRQEATMPFYLTLLLILTITGITFVPDAVIPIMIWPLLLGLGNLVFASVNILRRSGVADEDMAPLLTSVFSFTLAIAIPFEHPRRGTSFLIAFVAMVLAGVIWSAWRATKESSKPSDHFKHHG